MDLIEAEDSEELDLVDNEVFPDGRTGASSPEISTEVTESTQLREHTGDTDNEELSSLESILEPAPKAIYISKQDGQIRKENAIKPSSDGSVLIVTPTAEPWEQDRHIRPRDLKLLFIFSVISIILFFPVGIPAMFYAKKTSRAFSHGLEIGDLENAKIYSKICERLITVSIVCGLLSLVLILSLVEKEALNGSSNRTDTPRFVH